MTTHLKDMMISNITKNFELHESYLCLQYSKQQHSKYFDSDLGCVKPFLTNTFFGLNDDTGSGVWIFVSDDCNKFR